MDKRYKLKKMWRILIALAISAAMILNSGALVVNAEEQGNLGEQSVQDSQTDAIPVPVSVDYGYEEAFQVLELVNQERVKQGFQEIKMDQDLLDAAMLRAAEASIYFSHTRPTGETFLTACNKMAAENLAAGQSSPQRVMNSWMNSSSHKKNILGNYQSIGIGVAKVDNCFYWAQCFGSAEAAEVSSSDYQNKTENTEIMISEESTGFSPVLYMDDTVIDIYSEQTVALGFDNGFSTTRIDPAYVDFSSSDESVCTISEKGKLKALKTGESTIRASLKGYPQIFCESEVQVENDVEVSQIRISGMSRKIAAGKKIRLTAKILPDNASYKKVVWKSGNKKVATVNSSGVVTVKKGSGGKSVTITAKAMDGSGVKATYKITSMKGIVKKVSISGKKTVKAGKTLKLKGKVTATKSANKTLKWTSSNKKYATVSNTGKVKTFKAGKGKKVKITAKATDGSGKQKTITIKIK